jgi:hypothetical protein
MMMSPVLENKGMNIYRVSLNYSTYICIAGNELYIIQQHRKEKRSILPAGILVSSHKNLLRKPIKKEKCLAITKTAPEM